MSAFIQKSESRLESLTHNVLWRISFSDQDPNSYPKLKSSAGKIASQLGKLFSGKNRQAEENEFDLQGINKLAQKCNLKFTADSLDRVLTFKFVQRKILNETPK